MLTESITYPTKGGNALTTLVLGSVLTLLGVLLLPQILVFGYVVRVARSVSNHEPTPPDFDDWLSLFVDGLKLFGILLAYFIVPSVLIVVGLAAFWTVQGVPDIGLPPSLVQRLLVALGIGGLLLVLFGSYVAPAGIVNFARTGRMRSAFAFRTLWPVLTSGSYGVAWVLALGVLFAANVIVGVLAVTVVGTLLGTVVYFYATVVSSYLYACGFREVRPAEPIRNATDGRPVG